MTGMLTCKAVPYWYVFTNKSVQMFLTLRVKPSHTGSISPSDGINPVLLEKARPLGLAGQVTGPGTGHLYMLRRILRIHLNK